MSKKLVKKVAVALLSASMLLSSTGITSLAVNNSGVAAASSASASVSVSDDTANITKSGGSLTSNAPKMSPSGGAVSTQSSGDEYEWDYGQGTQADPYQIYTVADFLGIQTIINDATRSDKYFILMQHIDLTGVTLSQATADYSGLSGVLISASKGAIASAGSNSSNIFFNIDGNGCRLKFFSPTNAGSQTVGIFGYINASSAVYDLTVDHATVNTTYTNSLNCAVFAVQNEGTISNCTFDSCVVKISAPQAVTEFKNINGSPVYRGTAIIAGENMGTIENCSVVDSRAEFEGNARYVGIVAGQNRGTISNVNLSSIKLTNPNHPATSDDTAKFIGGVAGSNTSVSSVVTGCTVDLVGTHPGNPTKNNISYGDVVGGAVGKNAGSVTNTVVKSMYGAGDTITTSDFTMYGSHIFGGVVGENQASGTVTSSSALNIGAYIQNDNVTRTVFGFGGIVGRNSGVISKCVATGKVVDSGSASTYMTAGGLVAYTDATTPGSLNNSFAFVSLPQSHADIGALIGRGGSSALLSNCYFDATVAGRSFPCESYPDAFSGNISSNTKAVILTGTAKTVNKADLTPSLTSVNQYILPAFNFTQDTPDAYLESGSAGITVTNPTNATVMLTSTTAGSADNLLVTSSVTMAATIGSTAGVSFDYIFKVPVLYPSAHTSGEYILISNSGEFNFVKYSPFSKFKLNANVTASSWTPFNFFGVIDGSDYTLTVTQPLFTRVLGSRTGSLTSSNESTWKTDSDALKYGYIHNLTVILNSDITNSAVFGSGVNVTFTDVTFNSAASSKIIATKGSVGAFLNEIKGGAYIYNCYTNVPIQINGTNLTYFGGMAARISANDLIMDNCGSSSSILSQSSSGSDVLASLIGSLERNSTYGKVSNCYATGKVESAERRCFIAIGQYNANAGSLRNIVWSINNLQQGAKEPISVQSNQSENFNMWKFSEDYGMVNESTDSTFAIGVPTINAFSGAVIGDFTIDYNASKLIKGTETLANGAVNIPLRQREGINPDSSITVTHAGTGLVARLSIVSGLALRDGYYEIASAADLMFMSSKYAESTAYTTASFKVTADIDMSGYTLEPIVTKDGNGDPVYFSGKFVGELGANGERYTISNLNIVPSTDTDLENSPTALFSYVTGTESSPATFENLIFDNVTVSGGDDYVAVVAGRSLGSVKFSNISINSAIVVAGTGKNFAGGLLGGAYENTVTSQFYGISISDLSITANNFAGGFAGFLNGKNTNTLQTLNASVIVDKTASNIPNTLEYIVINADGFAGAVFGAVSDTSTPDDSVLTDAVVNASLCSECNYNNISLQISNVTLSGKMINDELKKSAINTVNWAAGGLVGVSNAAGYPDDYSYEDGTGSFACRTWVKNCEISDTDVSVTPPTTLDANFHHCSAGLVAGIYSGLVDDVTVSDCDVTGAYVGGLIGSKNFVYASDESMSLSGIAIEDCEVIGSSTLTLPRTLEAPIAGGILGSACDWAEPSSDPYMPYLSIVNCGVGQDVTIYSNYIAGGICGDLNGYSGNFFGLTSLIIDGCTSFTNITNNYGDMSSPDSNNYFGGIAGVIAIELGVVYIKNCAVGGSIYSSSTTTSEKHIGGLVGRDEGIDYIPEGYQSDPLFSDCYIAVQLRNNSTVNSASIADGYIVGYSNNNLVADDVGALISNIKVSSFNQSTNYIIGYNSDWDGIILNLPVADVTDNDLFMDVNKDFSTTANTPASFAPGNSSYILDNSTLTAEFAYEFSFDSAARDYEGMPLSNNTNDTLVFSNATASGKISGWASSNGHVQITSAAESASGSDYTYTLNIRAYSLGTSEVYGEFASTNVIIPGTNNEKFTFKVGIKVTSRYTTVTLIGSGTPENPYIISTEEELGVLVCSHETYTLNKSYILGADIDLTGELFPIGSVSNPFTGSFDGDGYTITAVDGIITIGEAAVVVPAVVSGAEIKPEEYGLGFFGCTNGATISNLNLDGFRIEAYNDASNTVTYAGAVAAYAEDTVFNGISVKNTTVGNALCCGGMVGHAGFTAAPAQSSIKSSSVKNSSVSAISNSGGNSGVAGGIVAEFSGVVGNAVLPGGKTEDILVEGCHISSASDKGFAGGIIGRNIYNSTPGSINITVNYAKFLKAASDPENIYEINGSTNNVRSAIGGIIGAVYDNSANGSDADTCTIRNSVVGEGVDIRNTYVAGGIMGYSYLKRGNVIIDGCESYANVTSTGATTGNNYDTGAAAIIGFIQEFTVLSVKNSVAGGRIAFNGSGGGIIGDFRASSSIAGLNKPIVYNCVVSAEIVDQVAGSAKGLVFGEYYASSDRATKTNTVFPSGGTYSTTPFMNIFFSGYQHSYSTGSIPNMGRYSTLNTAGHINSLVKFIDLNCLKYSDSDGSGNIPPMTVEGFNVVTKFTFDQTSDLYDYLESGYTAASFRVSSELNGVSNNHEFTLKNVRSRNNKVGYDASLMTVNAIGEGSEDMEFVYDNGIVISLPMLAISDLHSDAQGNYLIERIGHLMLLSTYPNAGFKQTKDLNFAAAEYSQAVQDQMGGEVTTYDAFAADGEFYNEGAFWLPVNFGGTYDGDGHKIQGLKVNSSGNAGFIGNLLAGGTVKNLTLEGANIVGDEYVGAVAAIVEQGGQIDNVTVKDISSLTPLRGSTYVGGIAGLVKSESSAVPSINACKVSNCWINNTSDVNSVTAGIAACSQGAYIKDCIVEATAAGSTRIGGGTAVGTTDSTVASGIVGIALEPSDANDTDTEIEGCSVGTNVDIIGLEIATGVLAGTGFDDISYLDENYINITGCTVGSGTSHGSGASRTKILSYNDTAGGIFSQASGYTNLSYILAGSELTIRGCKVGSDVAVLAGADESYYDQSEGKWHYESTESGYGVAGGIVGSVGDYDNGNDYPVHIWECESYAAVTAFYAAASIMGQFVGPIAEYIDIETSVAGGKVYALDDSTAYACGFIGDCYVTAVNGVYSGDGIIRDCIFSAELTSECDVAFTGVISPLLSVTDFEEGDYSLGSTYNDLFKNIYYSSYQTNFYNGDPNADNYDPDLDPVCAFALEDDMTEPKGFLTLIDISTDVNGDGEPVSVVMVNNTPDEAEEAFSPIAFTKLSEGASSYKRPVQVNLRNVLSIDYDGAYGVNYDANGYPAVVITRSNSAVDVGIKNTASNAEEFNLSTNENLDLDLPITVTGVDVAPNANGLYDFVVSFNNIQNDDRHSAQITPLAAQESITKLIVEITGGLKIPVQLMSADLNGNGTASDPFLVESVDNLGTASRASGGFYWKQTTDLDLTNPPANFAPIGSAASPFKGGYDGNGYRITNLSFNLPSTMYVGLFGYVTGNAQLKNIHIELGSGGMVGYAYVGGLVGSYTGRNMIINCSVVNSMVSGVTMVGGLAGNMTEGARQCFTSTQVKAIDTNHGAGGCGGITGGIAYQNLAQTFVLDRCFTSGSVTAHQSCGAFIGSTDRGTAPTLQITDCFSTADVFYVYQGQTIEDTRINSLVGYEGFVSGRNVKIDLTRSYFAGTNSRNRVTKLLPDNYSIEGERGNANKYTDVYYDSTVTGEITDSYEASKISRLTANGTLPANFSSDNWTVSAGNYPALKMADQYSDIYSHIGAMGLVVNENEVTPEQGFRYSITIPASIDSSTVSVVSSEKGTGDETVAYNSNYDQGLTGNTSAKQSDFLWKTDSGRIALLRNVFGASPASDTSYEASYQNNKKLPYVTVSYTKSCTFTELTYAEGDTPASSTVSITASRKLVVPVENASNSYYVATERQLRAITTQGMGNKVSGFLNAGSSQNHKIYIGYDIDLNGAYTPISELRGKFYGGGNTISGVSINLPSTDYVGFFMKIKGAEAGGVTTKAEVSGLTLRTLGVTGKDYVGTLAGYITDTVSISDCYVYAENVSENVLGTVSGVVCVGGMIGAAAKEANGTGCSITRCGSYIAVSGDSRVGGLIGMSVLPIVECGSTGNVSATVSGTACALNSGAGNIGVGVGGLVGTTTAQLSKSYASGSVTVSSVNDNSDVIGIGGLAGIIGSGTSPSLMFSSGEVNVTAQSSNVISNVNSGSAFGVGGLIGVSGSAVSSCYSGSYVRAIINANTTINANNKGVGGLIGVSNGLQDAYSSGAVGADSTVTDKGVAAGRVIGTSVSGSNSNLYYDSLKKESGSQATTGIGGVSDADSGIVGIKTTEFFKKWGSGGHFNSTNWSINDGAYPVLKEFFSSDVSDMIKNAVALSVVTVTFDERDTSAVENGIVTMAFKMPTSLTITTDEMVYNEDTQAYEPYSENFSFTAEPVQETGLAQVEEVSSGSNVYVPKRTSNAAQDIKFNIFVTGKKEYGMRSVNLACPEMLGTQNKPYLVATKDDLQHVAMNLTAFDATASDSYYKYWVTPISISGETTTVQPGKVYYKFIGDVDMTGQTYYISDLSNVTYDFGGGVTKTFAGFDIEGSDFSVDNLSLNNTFIAKVNSDSEIRNLMFNNLSIAGNYGSNHLNNIALIGTNSGKLNGIIVRTVSGNINGNASVAGLVVTNTAGGEICNSIADVTLVGSSLGGGLVSVNSGTIERCVANVNITAAGDTFGGFVAQNNGTITDCFSMGSITATSRNQIGGFVGYNAGTISSAYSTVNVSGCIASTSGLFAGQNTTNGAISYAYSSGFAGYTNGSYNLFCGSNSATITDGFYDLSMAGKRAASNNMESSATTYELFSMSCFSEDAKKSTNTHGFIRVNRGTSGLDDNGYPQLRGLVTVLESAPKDNDNVLKDLKYRLLQAYSNVSTAGIKTAYGQFIDTLAEYDQNVPASVNKLTPGVTWSKPENVTALTIMNTAGELRATAAVTDVPVTASANVVINTLRDSNVNVSRVFKVSSLVQNPLFGSGDGSVAHPYQIANVDQFNSLKYFGPVSDANYVLTADILGSGMTQIPLFKGKLDGTQHAVYNYSSTNGLFKDIVGGTVKNLGITGASITNTVSSSDQQKDFGMLAASIKDGAVLENCYAIGSLVIDSAVEQVQEPEGDDTATEVTPVYVNVGGLVGSVYTNSVIRNCASSGEVINNCTTSNGQNDKLHDTVGGIAGIVSTSVVSNCMSTAFVTGYGEVGGIVGCLSGSNITRVLFAGSAADDGMRNGIAVADGASVGNITGVSNNSTVTGAIIDSQTAMFASSNADAKTTKDLINMTITDWSTANGTSYPVPFTVSGTASAMFTDGLSAVRLPIFFEYKDADGSVFGYDKIKVPTTTITTKTVTVAEPDSMDISTAGGYYVIVPESDPQVYKTAVLPVVTLSYDVDDGNSVTTYPFSLIRRIEPKLVRTLSLSYDVKTDETASDINGRTVGVQIKNKYGALNMSSEAFTTAAALQASNPSFENIAVPLVQSGFYVGAKLPKGYEYQVKWAGYGDNDSIPASEDVTNEAAVIENEYGCFVDVSECTDNNIYFEITIVQSAARWGVFDSWDSLAS